MKGINVVVLTGTLDRSVELRHTPAGIPVADVVIAQEAVRKGEQPRGVEVPVTVFGKLALNLAGAVAGSPISILGRVSARTWKGRDGKDRVSVEVVAYAVDVFPLGGAATPPRQQADSDNALPF